MNSAPGIKSVCIVVPAYNEEENLQVLVDRVRVVMGALGRYEWRMLFVNDGSTDGTLQSLRRIAGEDRRVGYLSFSRNFGHQAALKAGLDQAADVDCVISMDADLQHPPELLPRLLNLWEGGYEIVYTVRRDSRETGLFKRVMSRWFYRIFNFLSDLDLDAGAADFRLLDRRVTDVIRQLPETGLFLRGIIQWIGFRHVAVPYSPDPRHAGVSKYSLSKMLRFASDAVLAFSTRPLRIASVTGVLVSLFAAVYGAYALLIHFGGRGVVTGWTSLLLSVLFVGGVQLLTIGVLGEYVGRLLAEAKGRPLYIVAEQHAATRPAAAVPAREPMEIGV